MSGPARGARPDGATAHCPWWRDAVVYQVYIRSFADADGDGIGDIRGVIGRLGHIAELGADAIWINPWYLSPMADGGYDVADYRAIDPTLGSLADAEELVREAHDMGLKVILDVVPNHTSEQHAWFQAALTGDAEYRARYVFRPGRGADGSVPPNDWLSAFGGSAWERETRPDGTPGEWYLHLYAVEQPDLNWENPVVRAEFRDILRFWFDRGVDGLRIDVAHGLIKADGLPDAGPSDPARQFTRPHPAWDQDGVHEIYRDWRAVADAYDPPRIFVAEAWVPTHERLALYLRPDELHTAFQIDLLFTPWRADALRRTIEDSLAAAAAVGATSTWVLANHDVPRTVTRYARRQPEHRVLPDWERRRWPSEEPDLVAGLRRARAAAVLVSVLPGSLYIYQGEELGLPEFEHLPSESRQDPTWWQSGFTEPGRDGCRVPLPWAAAGPTFGFGPEAGSASWLPQPADWGSLSVQRQQDDAGSMLALYRQVLQVRRSLRGSDMRWRDGGDGIVAYVRGAGADEVECWANTGPSPVGLPSGARVLLASGELQDGMLGVDDAVLFRRRHV